MMMMMMMIVSRCSIIRIVLRALLERACVCFCKLLRQRQASLRVARHRLTRFAVDGSDRGLDGDSTPIGCMGDVTVELVCVGVSITDGFPIEPLSADARLLFE